MASIIASRLGKLVPSTSALFVCDIQSKFRPVITGMPTVIDTAQRMVRGSTALGMPILVTEQYPKALGNTVEEITKVLPADTTVLSKMKFSMVTPETENWLKSRQAIKQVLLLGVESHVCVLQTSLDLLERGYEVHLVVDGVSSQRAHDRAVSLQRMAQSGAFLTSSESALFQLLDEAKHPAFKTISKLVQEPRADAIPFTASL